ncbi:MAG TPA: hypothetical protein VIO58_06285 [Candidatus Methanoperedens sp.]
MKYLTKIQDGNKAPHFAALPGLTGTRRAVPIRRGGDVPHFWRCIRSI